MMEKRHKNYSKRINKSEVFPKFKVKYKVKKYKDTVLRIVYS